MTRWWVRGEKQKDGNGGDGNERYKKWKINVTWQKKNERMKKTRKILCMISRPVLADYIITTFTIPSEQSSAAQRAQLIESCGLAATKRIVGEKNHFLKMKKAAWKTKCKYTTISIHLNEAGWPEREGKMPQRTAFNQYSNETRREEGKNNAHIMQINCSKTRLATFDHKWQYQPINRYTINTNANMLKRIETRDEKKKRFVLNDFFFFFLFAS